MDDHLGCSWLRTRHALTDLELDLVLMALAPEVDLRRYERIYGPLLDDLSLGRPLVGLVLDLLAATPEERPAILGRPGPTRCCSDNSSSPSSPTPGQWPLRSSRTSSCRTSRSPTYSSGRAAWTADSPGAAGWKDGWADGRRPVRLYSQGPAGSPRSRLAHDLAAGLASRC
ncbi:hypothetical protein ACH419_37090 [Streptomyces bobili]|uniref:hypothetical protein n=1 Tax=Streptomyces bobili TaxID=67280 RepID=UPI00378CF34C